MKIRARLMAAVLTALLLAAVPGQRWVDSCEAANLTEESQEAEFDESLFMDDLEDADEATEVAVADPLVLFNRAMFTFNDRLYFWLLKPVAKGYRAVVPEEVRACAKNFFNNLAAPVRMVNALLQGKPRLAGKALGHFFINTTAGLAGLGDPASTYPELAPGDEDLGQTLGTYGMGNGIYLVWPFLGPSTLRDSLGLIGDRFLDPATYVLTTGESICAKGAEVVNSTSFRIGEYESLKAAALEPYVALRDGYLQYRRQKVAQ